MKAFIFLFFAVSCYSLAQADTIYLKNGRNLQGIIKSEGKDFIEVEVSGGVVKFTKDEVAWTLESSDGQKRELREEWERDKAEREKSIDEQSHIKDLSLKHAEFVNGRQGIVVNAIINGNVDVKLILDTGSSLVVLRKSLANELGIESDDIKSDIKTILADGREAGAKHIMLRSVKVGSSEVENVDAAILTTDTQQDLFGDGVLGMSFLKHFNFKIDQKEKKLTLEKLL